MRVFLFGTGAMACLFASRLEARAQVTLLGNWEEAIRAIRERGVIVEECGRSRVVRVDAAAVGTPLDPADLVVVLVKSWQTERVANRLPDYLAAGGVALSLQNGLGNLERLGARAVAGATAEGAALIGPGHVRAGGSGPTFMAAPEWVVTLFRESGFDAHRCDLGESESLIWGKLAVSCGINALTALLRVNNGELLERRSATDLMLRATVECASVAEAKGIRLPYSDPTARVREVAARTAHNRSSMLQDLMRGAPTECDAIYGAVVAEGARSGVPTPVNEMLWRLMQAAANQNQSEQE